MDQSDKLEAYFTKDRPFREELGRLRAIAINTEASETFKWNGPVYTVDGKNVFGIMGFKNHFGIWFFNGVFLKDPLKVLESAQESTKALRHWKFSAAMEVKDDYVLAYMKEAIENQKKGREHTPEPKKSIAIPEILNEVLIQDKAVGSAFKALAPYKQREFCEYISSARQEKTKLSRLETSISLIKKGRSLNDKYRQD